jgi:hypothetical protein
LRCRESGALQDRNHRGDEHILVPTGSVCGQSGVASAGTFTISPPGSAHRVTSEADRIVRAIWEISVKIL